MKYSNCKIWLEGGIGDCIKALCYNFPIQRYRDENDDFIAHIAYGGKYNDCGHSVQLKELVSRIGYCRWLDNTKFDENQSYELTFRRNCPRPEVFNGKAPKLFDLELEGHEESILKHIGHNYIVIQLSGNESRKLWDRQNYIDLIQHFRERYTVVTIDWPCVQHLPEMSNRKNCYSLLSASLALSIKVVSGAKLIIAPDSWTKYVGGLLDKKQVILCPDPIGPYFKSIESTLDECFVDLREKPNTVLLGLGKKDDKYTIVPHVNAISVSEVIDASDKLLDFV